MSDGQTAPEMRAAEGVTVHDRRPFRAVVNEHLEQSWLRLRLLLQRQHGKKKAISVKSLERRHGTMTHDLLHPLSHEGQWAVR